MKQKHEKRQVQRLPTISEITFSDGNRVFTEFVNDISTGGIQVESPVPYDPGAMLVLSMPEPPVKVKGVVRWCHREGIKYRLGIQFRFDDPEQEQAIRQKMQLMFWETAKA